MNLQELKEGDNAILASINVSESIKKTLLLNGVCLGSLVEKNYSPKFAQLCNISIRGKMISIRNRDAINIEVVKYSEK